MNIEYENKLIYNNLESYLKLISKNVKNNKKQSDLPLFRVMSVMSLSDLHNF